MQAIHVDPITYKIEQKMSGKSDDNDLSNRELTNYQKDGLQKLYNLGLYYAENYFEKNSIDMIRIRVEIKHSIPFSKRNDKSYVQEISYITQEWITVSKIKGDV